MDLSLFLRSIDDIMNITKDKYKVVVVEHDEDDKLLLKEAFRQNSAFEVAAFLTDGLQLKRWLKAHKTDLPNAILAELYLFPKSGYEIIAEIRSDAAFRKIPVFITSVIPEKLMTENWQEAGAAGYLTKPLHSFEYRDYADRLYHMIRNTKKHSQVRA